jgi:striatin 1/3/4
VPLPPVAEAEREELSSTVPESSTQQEQPPALYTSSAAEPSSSHVPTPPENRTNGFLAPPNGSQAEDLAETDDGRVTAIFRPESSGAWKERLRAAAAAAGQDTQKKSLSSVDSSPSDDDLHNLELEDDKEKEPGQRLWRTKRILAGHLDSVRCLAFDRDELGIVTGGDDYTVKVWRLNPSNLMANGYVIRVYGASR